MKTQLTALIVFSMFVSCVTFARSNNVNYARSYFENKSNPARVQPATRSAARKPTNLPKKKKSSKNLRTKPNKSRSKSK